MRIWYIYREKNKEEYSIEVVKIYCMNNKYSFFIMIYDIGY